MTCEPGIAIMKRFTFLVGVAAAALATAAPAVAQEVIMRRPLIVPTKGAEWRVSPFLIYDNNGNVVQPANACGPYEERRDVQCVVNERPVGDSYCRDAGPKPDESKQSFIDTGCSYDWFQGEWLDPGPSCSNAETQERVVECRRSYDDVKVADTLCSGTKPTTDRTVVDHSTCTYSWNSSDPFTDPGANCTATEEWTRDVFCERDLDKVQVADGQCSDIKPTAVDVREDYSSCTYSWKSDETFTDPGDSCTANETQTRAVWCERDLDGNVEDDAKCNASGRPAASQSVEDFSGCDYKAVNPGTWNYSSSCSANTTRTRISQCERSDGTIVDGSECTDRDVALTETETGVQNLTGCNYSAANWTGPANPTCSAASTKTEAADCLRSDGTVVPDAQCTSRGIALTRTTPTPTDYSGCSYSAVNPSGWTYSSTCSTTASMTRSYDCRRSDGTIVPGAQCTSRGIPVTETRNNVGNTTGCSYDWIEGGFGAWSSTCSNSASRTQTVTCRRSDGVTVSNSSCDAGTKPATSESMANYSTCDYTAVNWTGWTYASACSTNTSRTRTADCRRSDGTIVADSECTGRSVALSETQNGVSNTAGCTYAAANWTNPANPTCSAANTETQTADCRRSDGVVVADSVCAGQGISLTRSVSNSADYSGCSYQWITGGWQDPGASCSPTETQTRSVICRRTQTGETVNDGFCGSGKPPTTQTVADYTGCSASSLTVSWGGWSGWNSTCSTSATRTRTGTCIADGQAVAASICTSRGVAVTDSESSAQYSGCSYTPGYGAYGSCSNGTQSAPITSCNRNGVNQSVATSFCTGAGHPSSISQTCSVVVNNTYCTNMAKTTMASGPWWIINRPLGSFNGTFDQSSVFKIYINNRPGANYDASVWTWDAGTRTCRTTSFQQSNAITECKFKLDANGQPYPGSTDFGNIWQGQCTALY